jgi:hypothetical protein
MPPHRCQTDPRRRRRPPGRLCLHRNPQMASGSQQGSWLPWKEMMSLCRRCLTTKT